MCIAESALVLLYACMHVAVMRCPQAANQGSGNKFAVVEQFVINLYA